MATRALMALEMELTGGRFLSEVDKLEMEVADLKAFLRDKESGK